ncbi:MAG: hypothetical protein KatS3mg071_0946 [Meiothermus sp.]|nr:MAG: hypothetical protein KatS3mg071_0946 [Meiothermus sp.]
MAVILALLLDWFFREPPARLHPVVWMGTYLKTVGSNLTANPPIKAFLLGGFYWLLGCGAVVGVYAGLEALITRAGEWGWGHPGCSPAQTPFCLSNASG